MVLIFLFGMLPLLSLMGHKCWIRVPYDFIIDVVEFCAEWILTF